LSKIKVVIADDHPSVRNGLQTFFSSCNDLIVAGTASNGEEALDLIYKHHPQVLLLDIHMPSLNGIEVLRRLNTKNIPSLKVLALTSETNPTYIIQLVKLGVAGYVTKDAPEEIIVQAVREVANGSYYINPTLAIKALQHKDSKPDFYEVASQPNGANAPETLDHWQLTSREKEVLSLLCRGYTDQGLAKELVISAYTVSNHVKSILSKLGLSNRKEVIVTCLQKGWVKVS